MRYSVETKLTPAQMMMKAERYFTTGSDELKVADRGDSSICIESKVGSITIAVEDKPDSKKNTALIETDGYDLKVKDFIKSL